MSSGSSFDKLLRDVGQGREADDLLIATNQMPRNPHQPAGISFIEYKSMIEDMRKLQSKAKRWKIVAILMFIITAIFACFSMYSYEKRYFEGAQDKYHEILTYPDKYHLVSEDTALEYALSAYELEEVRAKYNELEAFPTTQTIVYVTQNGSKYHKQDCRMIQGKDSLIQYSNEEEVRNNGYSECAICFGK